MIETRIIKGHNVTAIEKIISECAMRDYLAFNPRKPNGMPKYKKHRPYSLSSDTKEAMEIRNDYVAGRITEEEYKAYCLRYNLAHLRQ